VGSPFVRGAVVETRVLRGGAFNNNENNVRCAVRNNNNPTNRNTNNGFRIVVSTPLRVLPEMSSGYGWPTEALRDGATVPWPSLHLAMQAGRI